MTRHSRKIVLLCFFLSGMTSLIYEMVWTRWLILIFGSTTFAISTVLTAFMGGLALGSFLFGRARVRWGHPLLVYAILEGGIGLYALLLPLLIPLLEPLYGVIWASFHPQFYLFSLIRLLLVALALIIPTTLMGATLPVLSVYFGKEGRGIGYTLGFLYFLNTSGAILGSFAGGFIFLPFLGLFKTTLLAVGINLFITLAVVVLSRVVQESPSPAMQESFLPPLDPLPPWGGEARVRGEEPIPSRGAMALIFFSFALSGFAAMAYQVAWSRALSLVLGSSVYAFSAMLTTFLAGLALGSILSASIVERLRARLLFLAFVQLGVGFSAFLTLRGLEALPYEMISLYGYLLKDYRDIVPLLFPFIQFLLAFSVMFLPTLFLGMIFPIIARIYKLRISRIDQVAGDVYSTNTVGAILGAFSAGFVLIPLLGIQQTLLWMVGLNMICGLLLFGVSPRKGLVSGSGVMLLFMTGMAGLFLLPPNWNAKVMSSGVFWHLTHYSTQARALDRDQFYGLLENDADLLFYREGVSATVTVERDQGGDASLKVNGRKESGERFMRTQVLIAHIPLLLSQDPSRVLVIGFGSGATVGSAALYPVKEIKSVELESSIVEASRFFENGNKHPLQDPRVEVIINDGRNYLLTSSAPYDVIISQPSLPWIAGASNLFTREFFQLGASRLSEGGVFGQWVSTDAIGSNEYLSIFKAFQMAFPFVMVFQTVSGDTLWVGSERPLSFDYNRMRTYLSQNAIAEDLRRVEVDGPAELLSLYLGGSEALQEAVNTAIPNTDDNNRVEFFGPYFFYGQQGHSSPFVESLFAQTPPHVIKEMVALARDGNLELHRFLLNLASSSLDVVRLPYALSYVNAALADRESSAGHLLKAKILSRYLYYEKRASVREALERGIVAEYEAVLQREVSSWETVLEVARGYEEIGRGDRAAEVYREALRLNPLSARVQVNLGNFYAGSGNHDEAITAYERAIQLDPGAVDPRIGLALQWREKGDNQAAALLLVKALQISPKHQEALFQLGDLLSYQGKLEEAAQAYMKLLALAPNDYKAHNNLGNIYQGLGDLESALREYLSVLQIRPGFFEAYLNLGVTFQRMKRMDQAQRIYEAALLLNPLDPSIHYNMGFLFEVKGEQKRAADSFRRFINLVPAGEQYAKQLQVAQERLASLTSRQ